MTDIQPTKLVDFSGTDGHYPLAGMIADAAGDRLGTTVLGGAYGDGEVFEIVKTADRYTSTPTVLASFNGTDGTSPVAGLIADAAGDLIGTTGGGRSYTGDGYGGGIAFEIAKISNGYVRTPTVVAGFTVGNGEWPHLLTRSHADDELYAGLVAACEAGLP
jgi:hypothetical protein